MSEPKTVKHASLAWFVAVAMESKSPHYRAEMLGTVLPQIQDALEKARREAAGLEDEERFQEWQRTYLRGLYDAQKAEKVTP